MRVSFMAETVGSKALAISFPGVIVPYAQEDGLKLTRKQKIL